MAFLAPSPPGRGSASLAAIQPASGGVWFAMDAAIRRTLEQLTRGECRWVLREDIHAYRQGGGFRICTPLVDQVAGLDDAVALIAEQAEALALKDGDASSVGRWFDREHGVSFHANATGFPTMELGWVL